MLRNVQSANAFETPISEFILSYILKCIHSDFLPCPIIDVLKPD